jgi:hypothetical protein
MPQTSTPSARRTPALALFAAAVAATAAIFGIARAIARQDGKSFFVSYDSPLGGTVHTKVTARHKAALHRFERAIIQDNLCLTNEN